MNRSIVPVLLVGLSTALAAQADKPKKPAEQLWQVQIRGISG